MRPISLTNKSNILVVFCCFLVVSCASQKVNSPSGVLQGTIGIYEGNCMPGPGVKPCEPRPISTKIYITELSEEYEEVKLVASTISNADGEYSINLPSGTYSLFLGDGNQIICDFVQCPDKCYCQPFTISPDSVTIVDANIDHASW